MTPLPLVGGPRLRVIAINDVYALDALPRLASLVRHYRTEDPADLTLITLAGDFLSPSMLSSLDGGQGMIDCLNAVGVTHVCFGNHEDDLDRETLDLRISEFRGTWLSTNIFGFEPPLPRHDIVEVVDASGRKVRLGLAGVCTLEPKLYRTPPFDGAPSIPPEMALADETASLLGEYGCDMVIPLTHLSITSDRALVRATAPLYPVILGGHDHQIITEEHGGTWLLKAGADALHAHVVDITFSDADRPTVSVKLEDVTKWPVDPALAARVNAHLAPLRELESAIVFIIPDGQVLSSVGTRRQQTTLGTLLTSCLRDVFRADLCIINGGGIRGSREHSGFFTFGDLKAEVPFDNEMTVARIPGHVVAEAIRVSRAHAPEESGAFLQIDDGVLFGEEGQVVTISGLPFEPDREYNVALIRELLGGMDGIAPLLAFARSHPEVLPPIGNGREVKQALVETFARGLFAELGGMTAIDTNGDNLVCVDELARSIQAATGVTDSLSSARIKVGALDTNHDGFLDAREVADPE